jgi:hypothetical protein
VNIGLPDLCGYQFGWLELAVLVPISENQIGTGSDFGSGSGTGNRSKTKPNSRTRIKKFENTFIFWKKRFESKGLTRG